MNLKDLMEKLDAISEADAGKPMPYGNPYTGPNAEKFAQLTPADQEWLTRPVSDDKGGTRPGAPDISGDASTNPILYRAPNKGKLMDKPTPAPTPGPTPNKPGQDKGPAEDIAKLNTLVSELEKGTTGQSGSETGTTTTTTTPTKTEPEKTLGQKAGIGAGMAAGGAAGAALGKKFGGWKGAALGGLTGAALGGMGVNAMQESLAKELTESFGYDFEDEQLDEYSMDQLGKDAGDFGRGAWNGVTLGTGDNIAAGVKSAFGGGTYKDELAKQTAASKEAEQRSPWLYGAGNVAGSIAVPVPGGAIAGGLIKGASTAAKLARGGVALGTNLAAQAGVDKLKQASDTKTLGYDPSKYPTTPDEIKAFQSANGLTPDGKIGPKTTAVLAKMGLKPTAPTVAEDIKSLQNKLTMIESGQWRLEEDTDYRVWLLENGTVVGEQGEVITDENILSEVNWGELGSSAWKGAKGIAKNFAGGLAGKAQQGTAKTADEIAAMQAARTAAGKKVLSPSQIKNLGLDTAKVTKAQGMANTLGQKIHMNPGKAALAAGGAVGAGALAYNALKGDEPATPTGGGGGTGGSGSETGTTTTPDATPNTTPDSKPTGGAGQGQEALIAQIKEIMSHDWGDDPEWIKATGHAQVVLDKVTKANPLQLAADAKNDTGSQSASPTGTTNPMGDLNKVAQDAVKDFQKSNIPDAVQKSMNAVAGAPTTGKDAKGNTIYNDKSGVTYDASGKSLTPESAEAELARWLKIARG